MIGLVLPDESHCTTLYALSLSQVGSQRKRRSRSAARRSRKVVDLVDGSGLSQDDEGDDVIVRIGVEEEDATSSATDEGTVNVD